MNVVIIDYGSGNLTSVAKAFQAASLEKGLSVIVSSNPDHIAKADRLVLPGVGTFADCMTGLSEVSGLLETLTEVILLKERPFLGICVGMQLMATKGLEHKETIGLNWVPGFVEALTPSISDDIIGGRTRVPHMGWNQLILEEKHVLFANITENPFVYFAHSYQFVCDHPRMQFATVKYGSQITAAVADGNKFGVQFHPEKSQIIGLRFIQNFLNWKP